MKSPHRAVRLALGLTTGLALTLAGAPPASAATWTLNDIHQQTCVTSRYGHPGTYFLAQVTGTWSANITLGLSDLPSGSTVMGGLIGGPGSNSDPTLVNGFVGVSIAPAPVGTYTAHLVASDGTVTQTNPITIHVKDSCP
ncbi:DUF5980 family protein [Microbispora triticiradicis]|uniref:Uncharacterized protein n=3 Tax=Microbispora TaxID=2005 RepID=A0ABY3LT35_9ACTN|nr:MULTISPECIES: DUF5980 family protein [Microbispora]RGA04461.1 hypothetical protein DI270_013265 [Microbispora triticiradicis]TLP64033.1 hypothetical protein FED44_07440 [Microbispora fusca]TYB51880.1 hypothetical protein FXF59_25900 [Microbispora tritici]GLW20107.1 hypothetical protein Mame01_01500 [Microbispora amethystogenes]